MPWEGVEENEDEQCQLPTHPSRFTDGVANEVTGCSSSNSAGTPMTAEAVASYVGQGNIPPTTVNYEVSRTTLLLTSSDTKHGGIGRGPGGTTFTKVP